MIRLLRFLFTGDYHLHKWKILEEGDITKKNDNDVVGKVFILQCEICGEIKTVRAMA